MRILSAKASNFGSYKDLFFSFKDNGLALVQGVTGSGKSTLLDLVPFVLFGMTAKGLKADEIRSWTPENSVTRASLTAEVGTSIIEITRVRGASNNVNDLYFTEDHGLVIRGKDNTETQKLLNARLLLDFSSYTTAAYVHDQSPASTFFIASAKDRRELFEKITDLSVPRKLHDNAQILKKETKKTQTDISAEYNRALGAADQLGLSLERTAKYYDAWEESQKDKIKNLTVLRDNFQVEQQSQVSAISTRVKAWELEHQLLLDKTERLLASHSSKTIDRESILLEMERLSNGSKCTTCGLSSPSARKKIDSLNKKLADDAVLQQKIQGVRENLAALQSQRNPHSDLLNAAKVRENTYEEQLQDAIYAQNPHESSYSNQKIQFETLAADVDKLSNQLKDLQKRQSALEHIQDIAKDFRGALLWNSVKLIEDTTNDILRRYFDTVFSVSLTVSGDDLDVEIRKSGYQCSYSQLSKGQRRLLSLSFSVAVMKSAAHNMGMQLNYLAFDEPMDGCDTQLKQNAYRLFEDLAATKDTVLVIEHDPNTQVMYNKRYNVVLVGDHSEIYEES